MIKKTCRTSESKFSLGHKILLHCGSSCGEVPFRRLHAGHDASLGQWAGSPFIPLGDKGYQFQAIITHLYLCLSFFYFSVDNG